MLFIFVSTSTSGTIIASLKVAVFRRCLSIDTAVYFTSFIMVPNSLPQSVHIYNVGYSEVAVILLR